MKVQLGKLVNVKTGKLDANASSINGEYPFFTCSKEPLKISTYSYDCECVLVAGNGDLNVKYYNGKFDAYQRTYIIEDNGCKKIYIPYLYYFMDKYVEKLRTQSIGGVIKYIKLANITDVEIVLPNFDMQRKIVDKLDKVNAVINKKKRQLENLDLLVRSLFIEMFGDLSDQDKVEVSRICKLITDGTHQPPKFEESGIPFLFVSNIVTNNITYDTEKFISEETYKELIKRTPIEIGDLLLSTVGSYGHSAIVKFKKRFCFQRHIAYLKPKSEIVDSEYFRSAILSDNVQRQIHLGVKGIAQKTLNLSEIRKLRIPLPPMAQQQQFANFVIGTDKSKFSSFSHLSA